MKPADGTGFRQRVLIWVQAIPPGQVATYGQIAALAGSPRAARQVGLILARLGAEADSIPWQRVLNHQGKLSTASRFGDWQQKMLESEGIVFAPDGSCCLQRYQWKG